MFSQTHPGNPRVQNVYLGFATKADAQAYLAINDPSGKHGPGTLLSPPHGNLPSIPNPLTGIKAVGAFFSQLGQRNTWLRVLKVVIGVALVIVGVVRLTHTEKLVAATAEGALMA